MVGLLHLSSKITIKKMLTIIINRKKISTQENIIFEQERLFFSLFKNDYNTNAELAVLLMIKIETNYFK
jgi:hypothetical protein